MMLTSSDGIMAIIDEDEIKNKFKFDIDKFVEVKAWAIKSIGSEDEGDYWPILNGIVLKWSYSGDKIRKSLKLLDCLDRDFSFFVSTEYEMPMLIKIEKLNVDKNQKYLIIAPRIETITE